MILAAAESDSENGNDIADESSILPPANVNNVDAILETIVANSTPAKRDRFVLAVIKEACFLLGPGDINTRSICWGYL